MHRANTLSVVHCEYHGLSSNNTVIWEPRMCGMQRRKQREQVEEKENILCMQLCSLTGENFENIETALVNHYYKDSNHRPDLNQRKIGLSVIFLNDWLASLCIFSPDTTTVWDVKPKTFRYLRLDSWKEWLHACYFRVGISNLFSFCRMPHSALLVDKSLFFILSP